MSDNEINNGKQYLSEEELRILEVGDLEAKVRRLEKKLLEKDSRLLQLDIELKQERLKNMSFRLLESDRVHKDKLTQHKLKVDSIKERYGIPEECRWGHDPISGEIVVDKKGD